MPLFPQPTSNVIVDNEVPAGLVNGSNTVYTTASSFQTNSLNVYRNGVRLKGVGVDYTVNAGNNGFTMVSAPATGDLLLVDYNIYSANYILGSNSVISAEIPTGTINGATTVFTTSKAYIAGTLEVYVDGIHQRRTTDYTETTPGSGIFTFVTAPATGQSVVCNYQFNLNPASNADTVDGIHASTGMGTDGFLVPDYGGWQLAIGTFTFSSATVLNTPSDLTGWLAVGDKIRWKDGGAYKYGNIITISATQITLATNSDYSISNATITNVHFSKVMSPVGFPQWFNYTPSWTGFSVNPTVISRFTIVGRLCTVTHNRTVSGTSNATTFTVTAPVTSANVTNQQWKGLGNYTDNSIANGTFPAIQLPANSSIISLFRDLTGATWTAANGKGCDFTLTYEI